VTAEAHAYSDQIPDLALHDEIKCRAYELYEQLRARHGYDLRSGLQSELPRVIYAASQLQRYARGEVGETKAVRAARVYLGALHSFIG